MRKDSSVNKLNLEDFFKLYTERLMDYLNEEIDVNDVENECPKAHFNFWFFSYIYWFLSNSCNLIYFYHKSIDDYLSDLCLFILMHWLHF